KDIAQKYNIYEHVAALLESENSWFDTPKKQQNPKTKTERAAVTHSETPETQTNGSTETRSIPSSRHTNNNLPNGNIKAEVETKTRRTSARLAQARSQAKPESSKRLREDESEHENIKEVVQNLKRKLETEEYLSYSGSNKRRAVFAGIGAAVGAGVAAFALNSMGIGVSEIANGISDLTNKLWY
ncbi:17500_t:CDS:2, partial [Acaulospora colombiana]